MISDIKVWPVKKENSKIKANASFIVDNTFRIRCTIFSGEKGVFVGLPGRYSDKVDPETNKKKWYADVDCINDVARKELTDAVIKAYKKAINKEPDTVDADNVVPPNNYTDQHDNIPFG